MKRFKIIGLLAMLGLVGFAGNAGAQSPDCTGEGENVVGLLWSNGEFSHTSTPYATETATLYLFNVSEPSVDGWELSLDIPASMLVLSVTFLNGSALNIGTNTNLIVGHGTPSLPDAGGNVALAQFSFFVNEAIETDIFANPSVPASVPGSMAYASNGSLFSMYPIGGAGEPIANLFGPTLDYCSTADNQPPFADDDVASTQRNVGVNIDLIANDTDVDGTLDPSSLVLGPVSPGSSLTDNGDGTVTYMPGLFTYEERFTYTISDNDSAVSNNAEVVVTVTQPYDQIVTPDCIGEGQNMLGIVWENNQFSMPDAPDGQTIYGRVYVFNPSGGTAFALDYASFGSSFSVNPVMPYAGTFIEGMDPGTFSYMLDEPLYPDANGAVPIAELQIDLGTASGVNIFSSPAIVITFPVNEELFTGGDPVSVDLNPLGNDLTPIGSLNGEDLDFCGTGNQPPVAMADNSQTIAGQSVDMNLWVNDYDPDGSLDPASIVTTTPQNGGTIVNHGDGTITFTPGLGFTGEDYFDYTIQDDQGAVSTPVTNTVVIEAPQQEPGTYVQDFELLSPLDPNALANDGWLVFGNVYDQNSNYLYGYGPFPAPNDGAAFCQLVSGEGDAGQGTNQFKVFSDYNNSDHGNGYRIESRVFQEWTLTPGLLDAGPNFELSFQAKMNDLIGASTAQAFVLVMDPNAGYTIVVFETLDLTSIPSTWADYVLQVYLDPYMDGMILHFGFLNTATNYEGSGVIYDNVSFQGEEVILISQYDWVDKTVESNLDFFDNNVGSAWGDYDGDGDEDVYITVALGPNHLMRSNGDGTFSDLTTPDLALSQYNNRGAAWGDPDNDGDLDLYVCSNLQDAGVSNNIMFWNDGAGHFTRDESLPLGTTASTFDAQWIDYDGDGWEDLYLATFHTSGDILLKNNNGTSFSDETPALLAVPGNTYGSSWGDYDLDGDLDLFRSLAPTDTSQLLRNEGGGVFVDVTGLVMPALSANIRGSSWSDFDNDGDPDLYLAAYNNPNQLLENQNGVFVDITPPQLADMGPSTGANWFTNTGLIWLNDGAESHVVYVSSGGGVSEVTHPAVDLMGDSQAVSVGDFDKDGVTDLFVTNGLDGNNFIHRNLRYGGPVLSVKLVGTESARRATGAKIEAIVTGEAVQTQWIRPNGGMHAQGPLVAHFGWGYTSGVTQVDTLRVTWPGLLPGGGFITTVLTNVPVVAYPSDQVLTITEALNQAPVVTDMGELQVDLGQTIPPVDLSSFVTDEEPADQLTWSVTGATDYYFSLINGILDIQPLHPAWFGSNTLTVTVTDSQGLSGSGNLIVTVYDGFDLSVGITLNETESFYVGTISEATAGFDPAFDQLIQSVEPALVFDSPDNLNEYAYVRHLFQDQSTDVATVEVDGHPFKIPFGYYRAIPLGEFCIYECIWNESTQQYDCGGDCQFEIEGGKFYSLIWTPGGVWADIDLIGEQDEVWLGTDTRPLYDATNEVEAWNFHIESANNSPVPITRTLQFNPSFAEGDSIGLKVYDATLGVLIDLWPTGEYTYEIPGYSAEVRSFTLFIGTPGNTGDTDGDGVPDDVDECPGEDASFFDRDGDGCIDPVIGGRHIEYWAEGSFPLAYRIYEDGAPGISDGSDFIAIQDGFSAWTEVIGSEITVDYLGWTDNPIANAYDGNNTVTFSDDEYPFPSGVIAVGLSTSYAEADHANGIRPGQIIDTDMIFNPTMTFRTDTAGPADGTYIKGVVTHEAGHMLGLSHSGVQSSTMFYVLPSGAEAASLETEDRLAMYKAYYTQASYVGTSHLEGTVTDGLTGQPISGAIVYVITAANNDTMACDFTLPADGSYHFIGLPDGSYNLAIHPLNGSSNIGYLYPDNINALIKGTADILFEPEYWNTGESNSDDPTVFSPVFVSAGATAEAHFITNVDLTGPIITAVSPPSGATGVPIDSAILFRCNEAIDPGSLVGNFNFQASSGGGFLLGGATLVENGRTLAYTPTVNLEFSTEYLLEVGAGLKDLYGNTMGTAFSTTFTTEIQPPVAMSNLIPRKGVAGSILVINGAGFSGEPDGNIVTYGGVSWDVLNDTPSQLVVQVPDDAVPGTANIQVQRVDSGLFTNLLSYTVLPPGEEARGLETAAVDLFALPRQVEVSPDGDFVYIATDQGLGYVDVNDATAPVYGSLSLGNGLNDLDITPFGDRVYAISTSDRRLYRLDTEPVSELGSVSLDFRPLGILLDPSGRRAYLATDYNEIQVWDIVEGTLNFLNQVGTLTAPNPNLLGTMATDPAGNFLLALDGAGQLLVFDLNTFELEEEIPVLGSARDVVVDPLGERAYVTDETGNVSLISLTSFTKFLDIPTGGALQGAAVDPMGSFLYAVNHQLDNLDVIDLRQESPTYRTISARLPQQTNPVDVALSPDGLYAYVIVESDQRLVINTVGAGPMVNSLSRRSGPVGATVVLAGVDFTGGTVSFNGIPAVIERGDDTSLTVTVPPGATSGTVMVLGDEPGEVSNGIRFEVLDSSPTGVLRLASSSRPEGVPDLTGALSLASNDRILVIGGQDGRIHLQDVDPNSMDFNRFIGETSPLAGPVADLVVAPDGMSVFAVTSASSEVALFNINPGSAAFEGLLTSVSLDTASPEYLAVSPDGRYVLAADPVGNQVHIVNWADATSLATDITTPPGRVAFHPEGQYAYVLTGNEVVVLNLITGDPDFGNTAGSVNVAGAAIDLAFGPDGSHCFVLTSAGDRSLVTLDTSNPVSPAALGSVDFPSTAAAMAERLVLSPAGDRALLNIRDDGLVLVDLLTGDFNIQSDLVGDEAPLGFGFAVDGSRVFTGTSADGLVSSFDFNSDQQISIVWGNNQTGQMNQPLSTSLRVRVTDPGTGEGLDQVPVTFSIDTSGEVITKAPAKPVTLEKIPSFVPVKKSNHVGLNKGTPDGNKNGGELIDGAAPILALPFTDSGNTSDNLDDYDESCPSITPGAPDVVYSWTADFSGGIAIDLCGSGYDTKLYVYEYTGDTSNPIEPGNPWACNDDYYDGSEGCGYYVSFIEDMSVNEGTTYYIVIDGWDGDSGDYVLNVTKNYESSPWGFFVTDDPEAMPTHLTVGTDELGFAEVNWSLGYYASEQTVDVAAIGAIGSPLQFTATAVEDPVNLPFTVVESRFAPAGGATDVSVTTAIQIVFSRAIYTSFGIDENFFVSADGGVTPIDAVMGFASDNTAVSLTPREVLEYGTTYTVVVGETIYSDLPYMLLTNPQTFTFTTEIAPSVPTLTGISPPSGPELVPIMLSGSGFSPNLPQNQVFFGGVPAPVISAEPDFILTRVPLEVGSGELLVQVTVDGQPTNPLPFTVLVPTLEGADEVVVRIPTGSATRSATVSPDGAIIYAVAPESDLIIPIDLVNFTTLPSIPVGDMPWAISGHPDGGLMYVANRMSGDASVIDIDPDSPTYHQTIGSVQVGAQPVDILVTPAGDRVLVANEESQDLAVIDGDPESSTFNAVVNRVPVASSVKTVTVTPDGARIYLGTDEGYILIGSVDYGVIRRVPTVSGVKSVTVSPDGALLVVVETNGIVNIYDIAEGSPTEDQVVARVPVASSVKTATVSPDGARLYAVMDEGDIINVYALDIGTSVGAIDAPNPRPVVELVLLQTLTAGENPQMVVFDPRGSGRFIVLNAGDSTVSVFDVASEGILAGRIFADCPAPETPIPGVEVDIYSNESGELAQMVVTDENGAFEIALPSGPYTATMMTPLGFSIEEEERAVTLSGGQTTICEWPLECETIIPRQRRMGWWKRQFAVALCGWGHAQVDGPTLCEYLDNIAGHFNSNNINPVVIYQPPASGECQDKLEAARELLNFWGNWGIEARAKQQLLALLLNVASSRISLQEVISEDGANVSQAITYCDNLIDDGVESNDWTAWWIAFRINVGWMVPADTIPISLPNIFYSPVATHFHLDQNYPNPFNPECRIRFGVPRPGHVRLKIFDIGGRLVRTLVDEQLIVGTYIKVWDGTDNRGLPSASGVYFYKMEAGSFIQTRKMLLVK